MSSFIVFYRTYISVNEQSHNALFVLITRPFNPVFCCSFAILWKICIVIISLLCLFWYQSFNSVRLHFFLILLTQVLNLCIVSICRDFTCSVYLHPPYLLTCCGSNRRWVSNGRSHASFSTLPDTATCPSMIPVFLAPCILTILVCHCHLYEPMIVRMRKHEWFSFVLFLYWGHYQMYHTKRQRVFLLPLSWKVIPCQVSTRGLISQCHYGYSFYWSYCNRYYNQL